MESAAAAPTEQKEPAAPALTPEEVAEHKRLTRLYLGTGLSAILLYASFHPIDQGLLAWVALVPWLFVAATSGSRRAAATVSYSVTFLYHLVGLSWIAVVSPEGWLATTFLEGFYGIALACIPLWVLRRTGLPLCVSLPVVGAGLEWLRGNTPVIRFPWLLLGQTQHANETLIQVLDVTSVYGLTFLVLAVNGGLVDVALLVRARWLAGRDLDAADRRRLALALLLPPGLVGAAWGYGVGRLRDVTAALEPGPRVLVVQPDFPQNLKDEPTNSFVIARTNLDLTELALARLTAPPGRPKVDAIVWSETMWPGWRFPDFRAPLAKEEFEGWLERMERRYGQSHAAGIRTYTRQLLSLPDLTGATLFVGAVDWGTSPETMHNSIYALHPGQGVVARYDKINLVPASEYVPGKDTLLFHWLHRLIRSFVPEGFASFAVGEGPVVVEAGAKQDGTPWKLAPNICFEISFPELLRRSVLAGADVHVCPANDGWFVRGGRGQKPTETAELALARDHSIYRAIETRRPVVRCVNRGVSMIVDPTGKVTDEVFSVLQGKKTVVGIEGTFAAEAPVTRLRSFYLRFGDAFAIGCLGGLFALLGLAWRGKRLARDLAEGGVALPPDAPPPDAPSPDAPHADPAGGPSPEVPPSPAPSSKIPMTEAEAGSAEPPSDRPT